MFFAHKKTPVTMKLIIDARQTNIRFYSLPGVSLVSAEGFSMMVEVDENIDGDSAEASQILDGYPSMRPELGRHRPWLGPSRARRPTYAVFHIIAHGIYMELVFLSGHGRASRAPGRRHEPLYSHV